MRFGSPLHRLLARALRTACPVRLSRWRWFGVGRTEGRENLLIGQFCLIGLEEAGEPSCWANCFGVSLTVFHAEGSCHGLAGIRGILGTTPGTRLERPHARCAMGTRQAMVVESGGAGSPLHKHNGHPDSCEHNGSRRTSPAADVKSAFRILIDIKDLWTRFRITSHTRKFANRAREWRTQGWTQPAANPRNGRQASRLFG